MNTSKKQKEDMECTKLKNYDDEIRLLDIKHKERVDGLNKTIEEITEKWAKEREEIVRRKVEKELALSSVDYLQEFIDIELAGKFIKRSTGWIYQHLYDVDSKEPTELRNVPAHRRGNRLFFIRKELQDWMMQKKSISTPVSNNSEVERRANEYLAKHK